MAAIQTLMEERIIFSHCLFFAFDHITMQSLRIPVRLHMVIRTEESTGQNMKVQTVWFPWRPCSLPWKRRWFKK